MADGSREFSWQSPDDLRLHARIYDGPAANARTLLCLHGLTRNGRDFEDLAPHLQRHYRVLVPDLRGRGFSERDPRMENYQPTLYVPDIVGLLEATGSARCAIIGTSLGGLLAMMLAFTDPPRIAGIVLNDVGPEFDPVGIERIKQYAGRMPPVHNWDDAVAQTRTVYGAAWPGLDAERWKRIARRGYREDAQGIPRVDADPLIGEAIRSSNAPPLDLWPLWKALQAVPALAIRGALSDILSAATFARMRAEKPNLRQLTVAERGHVPLLDEPECVSAIDEFIETLDFNLAANR